MPISFYMDEHVPRAITVALRIRGVDVVTAREAESVDRLQTKLLNNIMVFTPGDKVLIFSYIHSIVSIREK